MRYNYIVGEIVWDGRVIDSGHNPTNLDGKHLNEWGKAPTGLAQMVQRPDGVMAVLEREECAHLQYT
jgi:hypothetical protein